MTDYYRPRSRIYLYPCGGPGGKHPFTQGTFQDLEAEKIVPVPGMRINFYCDDGNDKGERDYLLFAGVIDRFPETGDWYAVIDGDASGMNPTSDLSIQMKHRASKPLDIPCRQAVWPSAMKLNRTNRRACLRRRSSDDGLRRVRRQR